MKTLRDCIPNSDQSVYCTSETCTNFHQYFRIVMFTLSKTLKLNQYWRRYELYTIFSKYSQFKHYWSNIVLIVGYQYYIIFKSILQNIEINNVSYSNEEEKSMITHLYIRDFVIF